MSEHLKKADAVCLDFHELSQYRDNCTKLGHLIRCRSSQLNLIIKFNIINSNQKLFLFITMIFKYNSYTCYEKEKNSESLYAYIKGQPVGRKSKSRCNEKEFSNKLNIANIKYNTCNDWLNIIF